MVRRSWIVVLLPVIIPFVWFVSFFVSFVVPLNLGNAGTLAQREREKRMVFALFIEDSWKSIFILYLAMPLFIFFLVYTLALRERDTKLHLPEIMHKVIRSLFN